AIDPHGQRPTPSLEREPHALLRPSNCDRFRVGIEDPSRGVEEFAGRPLDLVEPRRLFAVDDASALVELPLLRLLRLRAVCDLALEIYELRLERRRDHRGDPPRVTRIADDEPFADRSLRPDEASTSATRPRAPR